MGLNEPSIKNTTINQWQHCGIDSVAAFGPYAEPESIVQNRFPAGTASRLRVQVYANTLAGGTGPYVVVSLRKNGVDTSLSVNIPTGSTATVTDDIDTVTVAAGDLLDLHISLLGLPASGEVDFSRVTVEFG
jgi:uncharacterized protein with ACT and thioredoxin-like domain